jgi:excisionase family DNA binding protein
VATARPALRLDLDLDGLVDEVATRVAGHLAQQIASEASSPWMAMEEAIAYTRIPAGTLRKWVAAGRIPAHGGRRKLFHRDELDAALGYPRLVGHAEVPRRSNGRTRGAA